MDGRGPTPRPCSTPIGTTRSSLPQLSPSWRKMLVLQVIIAAAIVVFVVGGLCVVLVFDRSVRRPTFKPMVYWWSLVGIALVGIAIAWTTSALS